MSRSMPLVAGNKNWVTLVAGVNPDYLVAREWQAANGRSFTGDEIASGAKVAIVGSVISEELFGGRVGIGETFRIGSVPFTVVGVLDKKGLGAAGRSQDDIVFIPLSTAKSRVLGAVRGTTREALDFISSYLKKRLKIELAIEPKRRELKSTSLEAAWQRLSAIVDETTVLILPLSGRLDHWTVLYDINARKIRLVDSSHRRELTRSRCTLELQKSAIAWSFRARSRSARPTPLIPTSFQRPTIRTARSIALAGHAFRRPRQHAGGSTHFHARGARLRAQAIRRRNPSAIHGGAGRRSQLFWAAGSTLVSMNLEYRSDIVPNAGGLRQQWRRRITRPRMRRIFRGTCQGNKTRARAPKRWLSPCERSIWLHVAFLARLSVLLPAGAGSKNKGGRTDTID